VTMQPLQPGEAADAQGDDHRSHDLQGSRRHQA
jgi:hypothetical protein